SDVSANDFNLSAFRPPRRLPRPPVSSWGNRMRSLLVASLLSVLACSFAPLDAEAAVSGRYVRFEAPASGRFGRPELLEQWSAISDDWGMNILGDLERSEHDLRDYFVKDELQWFSHFADELAQTARDQPEFARQLSGATLARLLIPVLEEYPPAYWWPVRRTLFNHTYSALMAATLAAPILDEFHAGQRLAEENRQHWQRIWTMCMNRDGSMAEIGDEGHLF